MQVLARVMRYYLGYKAFASQTERSGKRAYGKDGARFGGMKTQGGSAAHGST